MVETLNALRRSQLLLMMNADASSRGIDTGLRRGYAVTEMQTNGQFTSLCLWNARHSGIRFRADTVASLLLLACRFALASYLVLYLSLSGLISVERWSKGAHVTPDMWAEHAELTRLGYVEHHHDHHEAPASTNVLPFIPGWSALPTFPLLLDWTPFVAISIATLVTALVVGRLHITRSRAPFKDHLSPVPDRPPIITS